MKPIYSVGDLMSLTDFIFKVLKNKKYPRYALVDTSRVSVLETSYGRFAFDEPMQIYHNLLEQVDDYDFSDLTKCDIVLDIGACLGASSLRMAKDCKHVVAIEPLFYNELKNNIKLSGASNIDFFGLALAEGDSYYNCIELEFCNRKMCVKAATFQNILNLCKEPPTFLKMDCEGGEWEIKADELIGFRAIEAEIHNFCKKDPMDYVEMLRKIGFTVRYNRTKEGMLQVHARK